MSLLESTKNKLIKALALYEGKVPHLYLDSLGYVTVGIGHLLRNRDAMKRVKMHTIKNNLPDKLATLKQKQTEWDTIKALKKNKLPSYYKKQTSLIMKETEIKSLKSEHIKTFYNGLVADYTVSNGYPAAFDDLHENVHLALFDMIFNLGRTRLKIKFPSLAKAIKAEDWKEAAKQSNRPQLGNARNKYVKDLFEGVPSKPKSSSPIRTGGKG